MKSGTKRRTAPLTIYGRNAELNAMTDRALRRHSDTPYWNAGGTLGMPPSSRTSSSSSASTRRSKTPRPVPGTYTLPTARGADRATSRNPSQGRRLRVIYNPASTVLVGTT